jgi:hypothetical protein
MTSIEIPSNAIELRTTSPRSSFAMSGWPAVLFGVLFAAVGCGVVALGLYGDVDRANAPRTIIAFVGGIFVIAGLWTGVNGMLDVHRKRAAARYAAGAPGQPWAWDFAWQAEGIGNDTGRQIAQAFGFAVSFMIFLVPFHWLGFVKGAWPFAIGALVFDLIILGILARGIRLVLMRRRYGASWLRFKRFPFHPDDRVEVSLDAWGELGALPSLSATLRCVQERYEVRGSGNSRSTRVICYALWSATMTAERTRKGTFDIAFDLPPDAATCALSERPARFWSLELSSANVPGVDYDASFLIPVYPRPR